MNRSLSVLIPVHNAQSYLEPMVDGLLEILPELTADFEVLIVDDGSRDDTSDVARHLVARFPQLSLFRNDERLGGEEALREALAIARGEIVLLREEGTELDLRDIGKLWERMSRRQLVFARPLARAAAGNGAAWTGSNAISDWERAALDAVRPASATRAVTTAPGFKMLLRSVAQESTWWISGSPTTIAELTARGYNCEEIALRTPQGVFSEQGSGAVPASHLGDVNWPLRRRPNYLARILAITSGN